MGNVGPLRQNSESVTWRTVKVQGASRLGFGIYPATRLRPPMEGSGLVVDLGPEGVDCLVEWHHLLLFGSQPAYRNRAVFQLSLAHGEQGRDLGNTVLADLVGDLLVAQVAVGTQAGCT